MTAKSVQVTLCVSLALASIPLAWGDDDAPPGLIDIPQ